MNDDQFSQRAMALAGLLQALQEVRHLAENGRVDQSRLQTAIDSALRIDADSVAEVYGGIAPVADGLRTLVGYFENRLGDPQLPRLALSVLQLERSFSRDEAALAEVRGGIATLVGQAHNEGATHPDVLRQLGAIYAKTLSPMKPKVMVQGNPHYLAQADLVGEVRAALLAALRSAVLWRQLDGSLWDLLLRKRALLRGVEALLG